MPRLTNFRAATGAARPRARLLAHRAHDGRGRHWTARRDRHSALPRHEASRVRREDRGRLQHRARRRRTTTSRTTTPTRPTAVAGVAPAALMPYLPQNFTFDQRQLHTRLRRVAVAAQSRAARGGRDRHVGRPAAREHGRAEQSVRRHGHQRRQRVHLHLRRTVARRAPVRQNERGRPYRRPLSFQVIAGAGFEPATFGL